MYTIMYYIADSLKVLLGLGEESALTSYYFMDRPSAVEYTEDKLIPQICSILAKDDNSKEFITEIERVEDKSSELYCTLASAGKREYQVMIYIYKLELYQK